jgi:hypothetical protein
MSLGKLLTTGKSLVGLSGTNGRYQLRTGAMPKFESSKNPFAKSHAEPPAPKLSEAEIAAANLKKTQALPLLGEVREVPKVPLETCEEARAAAEAKAKEAARPAPVVDSWVKKLNPMVWFQKDKPAEAKKATPRFSGSKRPVQGELSLDNIRVMRNDLSEADVEVVPMKARPSSAKAAESRPAVRANVRAAVEKKEAIREEIQPVVSASDAAAMAIPDLPPATSVWEFLGERILSKE